MIMKYLRDGKEEMRKRDAMWRTEKLIVQVGKQGHWERSLQVVVWADKCQESATDIRGVPGACLVCLSDCIDLLLH